MAAYTTQWEQHGATWLRVFRLIEPQLRQSARTVKADVAPFRWEMPHWELRWWGGDNIARAVQVSIRSTEALEHLRIAVSAFLDLEVLTNRRVRHWNMQVIAEVAIPSEHSPETDSFIEHVSDALTKARETVSGWTSEFLVKSDVLPPLPEDVAREAYPILRVETLSPRERKLLHQLAGKAGQEIANVEDLRPVWQEIAVSMRLKISSVERYLRHIKRKLRIHDDRELARFARQIPS